MHQTQSWKSLGVYVNINDFDKEKKKKKASNTSAT